MNNIIMVKLRHIYTLVIFMLCISVFDVNAQEVNAQKVTGKVSDAASGEPVVGANVSVATFSSVFTGEDGSFSIDVPNYKVTLMVNAQAYAYTEVALKGRIELEIKLYEEGFKTNFGNVLMPVEKQSRSSVTNAISSIIGDVENSSRTVAKYMKGDVAGMRTLDRSGVPGVGSNMFIRGYNSLLASGQPLIVVDGMIMENNIFAGSLIEGYTYDPLADINPKDIANITVIKDATSLYGSKAANGVILIETTRTKDVTTKIDFSVQGGLNMAPTNIPMMESSDYKSYLVNQINSSGLYTDNELSQLPYLNENTAFADYQRYHNNTNWQKEVFEDSYTQDYFFRVTGGDEIAKYGLSIGFMDNSGIVSNTASTRFSTRFNSESTVTEKFSIQTNLAVSYQKNKLSDDGMLGRTSPIYTSLIKAPILAPTVIGGDGIITDIYEDVDPISGYTNPSVLTDQVENENTNYKLYGNFKLGYDLTNNLKLTSIIGSNYVYNRDDVFFPSNGVTTGENIYGDVLNRSAGTRVERYFSIYNDSRVSFNVNTYNHKFGFHLGGRYNVNNYENSYSESGNSSDDEFTSLQSGDKETYITSGSIGNWKYASLYSNINYGYLGKYFLNASMSYEGSSRFGQGDSGTRYGYFPSVGAAWLMSSENFMKGLGFLNQLKLRASYGITGNDAVGNYNAYSYFVSTRYSVGTGLISGNLANTTMQWERTVKANVGVDLGLFNERLQVNLDFYNNETDQLLNYTSVNPVYGYDGYLSNEGELSNTGFDLGFNARLINSENFKWDIGGNISKYKNEIVYLPGNANIIEIDGVGATVINQEGSPVGLFYGYKTDGIYATQSAADQAGLSWVDYEGFNQPFVAGDVKFMDTDGNNVIDEEDMQVIGDPNPDFTGMFYNTFTYNKLSLSAVFTFSQGNDIYNALRRQTESMSSFANQSLAVANRWQVEGQQTTIPRAEYGDPTGNSRFSDRWIEDGSYIRLKTLSLSYSPEILKSFAKDISFSVTANNLFTLTDYLGYDPEVSMSGVSYQQGIDAGLTPQFTSIFFGVKIGL
ncbi:MULTISPECIES: SusC/RagA family TonB-linked outer membrane protein [unclassified Saccharicrinis]|uniref:SusC/RagA family TonB-linked outer membrane protein n=1 Tax=unclassified Saccharicrinis TaxID=2646859 RepID=UPI003D328AEE